MPGEPAGGRPRQNLGERHEGLSAPDVGLVRTRSVRENAHRLKTEQPCDGVVALGIPPSVIEIDTKVAMGSDADLQPPIVPAASFLPRMLAITSEGTV